MSEGRPGFDSPPATAGNARARRVSGTFVAIWLVGCLLVTALLIPTVLRLPLWVEFEIVLGVWWVIWFAALTWFLYAGLRVTDDFAFHQPRNWVSSAQEKS